MAWFVLSAALTDHSGMGLHDRYEDGSTICGINFRVMPLHEYLRPFQGGEAEFLIQSMRIRSRQNPAPQALQLRVSRNALQQPSGQSPSLVFGQHEDIAKIGDRCRIADHTGKADLPALVQQGEAQCALK